MLGKWLRKKADNGKLDDDHGLGKALAAEQQVYAQSEQLAQETREFETKARRLERRATDPQCRKKETKVMRAVDVPNPDKEVDDGNT